ncbi:MAG TPA: hypothetical protein VKY92_15335 [Verrucomicrobiae bacterium]|nr:hypothetical protein [Verrucomicrobiae bacterium]
MNKDQENTGRFSQHGRGLGTVTEEMVRQRAVELAISNGRPPGQVLDSDIRQARLELTGDETVVPKPTPGEELTEEQRWQVTAESEGQRAPVKGAPDEQTFAEELVNEGLEDAEQDTMVKGTRQSQHRDREP